MKSRKIIAGLLALALLLGLAACAKTEPGEPPESAPSAGTVAAPTGTGAKRYVPEFKELRSGTETSVTPLLYTDVGFYAGVGEMVPRPLGEGVTPAYEGQYDSYQTRYYFISYDGDFRPLADYSPAWLMENIEGYDPFDARCTISGMFLNDAGELVVLETSTASYYAGPAELTQDSDEYWDYYTWANRYFLRRLDQNGGELSCTELDLSDCMMLNEGCVPDQAGNILLSFFSYTGETCVAAFAEDGTEAYRLSSDGFITGLVRLGDGRPAAMGSLPTGWGLQLIDSGSRSFTESYPTPSGVYELIPGDENFDVYYTSGAELWGCRLEEQEFESVLNWLDSGVNSDLLSHPTLRPDGTILAVENSWSGRLGTASLVTLRPAPADAFEEKQTLTLATLSLDTEARSAITDFNRQNDSCRIEVLDYSAYNIDPEDQAGLNKLLTEIIAGDLPDMLSLSGLPYDQLAAKGLLEDLYPYLDADRELSREDFFPSVLNAMEIGGGLYQVCPGFGITTAVAGRAAVGDRVGLSYGELDEVLAAMPEGCRIFSPNMTKSSVLYRCLPVSLDRLVDWDAGTCRFDSEEFLALLAFADRFPAEPPETEEELDGFTRLSRGLQLLRTESLTQFFDIQLDDAYFGGEGGAVYVGYPSFDGSSGSAIDLDAGFAMSAKCAHKEAAWDFLRTFMTEKYQAGIYLLPSNKARFEKNLAEAMIPTYVLDAQGNYVLDEAGSPVEKAQAEFSGDGLTFKIYAVTQGQADRVRQLIEGCTGAIRTAGDDILSIVLEDAQAYFAGQKSAEEVARLIQGKVSLYMSEQS